MNKRTTIIYHYTDSGDLVRCNQCGANMLVSSGVNKCPCCYFEGALQWLDEGNKETTVSKLDINPGYAPVAKNNPEPAEYLSGEILRDEFNMKPNPKHTYSMERLQNKPVRKKPDKACTVQELAGILLDMEPETELNFSENKDGSGYWGAKKLILFEQEIIIFGCYGGPALQKYEPGKDVPADMVRHLCYHLDKQEGSTVYLSDAKPSKNRKELQETIVSSFFYYMWNAWCKQECENTFGTEYLHFWTKWCGICERHSIYGAAERYYAELGDNYRTRLVSRACEMYDGNSRRK